MRDPHIAARESPGTVKRPSASRKQINLKKQFRAHTHLICHPYSAHYGPLSKIGLQQSLHQYTNKCNQMKISGPVPWVHWWRVIVLVCVHGRGWYPTITLQKWRWWLSGGKLVYSHVVKPLREAFSTTTTMASLLLRIRKMFPNVNFNKGHWTNASWSPG